MNDAVDEPANVTDSQPALPLARRCVEVVFVARCRFEDTLLVRAQVEELSVAQVTTSLLLVRENDRSGRNKEVFLPSHSPCVALSSLPFCFRLFAESSG